MAIDEESTLVACVLEAVSANAGIRAAHERWQAAMERIPQVGVLPDPKLTYAYYLHEVETRVGPQRQSLSLAQMFPWFGTRRLRENVAVLEAEAAWEDVEEARRRTERAVRELYHELYLLRRTITITEENFTLLESIEEVALERYRTGDTLTASVQAQVELGKLEDRLRSLRDQRPVLQAQLNALLNRDSGALVPWPEDVPTVPQPLGLDSCIEAVREHSPALRRLRALAKKQAQLGRLARKKSYPDFTVGLTVIDTDEALMGGTPDSGRDPVIATVSLNLPIWRDAYQAREREAERRRSAYLSSASQVSADLAAEVRRALYLFEDADKRIALYESSLLPKAEQSLHVTLQAFQAGKADFAALVDAQRILLEFEVSLTRAVADRGKAHALLSYHMGTVPHLAASKDSATTEE